MAPASVPTHGYKAHRRVTRPSYLYLLSTTTSPPSTIPTSFNAPLTQPINPRIMTRTERSQFPRALAKDRHDSRTGLNRDPHHVPKNGEGAHSWGSDSYEVDHETGAYDDDTPVPIDEVLVRDDGDEATKPIPVRKMSQTISEEERDQARALRAKALKDGQLHLSALYFEAILIEVYTGMDLGSIARSSVGVSTSPVTTKSAMA